MVNENPHFQNPSLHRPFPIWYTVSTWGGSRALSTCHAGPLYAIFHVLNRHGIYTGHRTAGIAGFQS